MTLVPIDWKNIGGLARAETKKRLLDLWRHDSWRELFIKASVLTTTIICGLTASQAGSTKNSRLALGFFGSTAGFIGSHAVVMISNLSRRYSIQKENKALFQQILDDLDLFQKKTFIKKGTTLAWLVYDTTNKIRDKINMLYHLPLPCQQKGDLTRNLQTMNKLLKASLLKINAFIQRVQDEKENLAQTLCKQTQAFWSQSPQELKTHFLERYCAQSPLATLKA